MEIDCFTPSLGVLRLLDPSGPHQLGSPHDGPFVAQQIDPKIIFGVG